MSVTSRFARRFRFLTLFQASLFAGALYDLAFAVLMVVAPGVPAQVLGIPLPGEPFYLWVMATLLAMLAALYVLVAREPRRYSGMIPIAVVGRLLGALAFAVAAIRDPKLLPGIAVLAVCDFALGVSPALFWYPVRK
jgi:uncharacterized membrane protein (DUF4010 family)